MSNCIHGKEGALSLGGTNIAMLTEWTLNETAETVDCTAMGDQSRVYKAGIKGFEGSAECIWAKDDVAGYVGQFTVGTEYAGVFYVTDTTPDTADLKYTGQVIVTGIEVTKAGAYVIDVQALTNSIGGTSTCTQSDATSIGLPGETRKFWVTDIPC